MVVHLEITDRAGFREVSVEDDAFWIGALRSNSEVELDLPECAGRVLEVKLEAEGGLRVRTEAGLPFPVRSVTGNIGRRFETLLDGDMVNVGPALVRIRGVLDPESVKGEALDPTILHGGDAAGAPVGSWYETFMEIADNLEGLTEPRRMVDTVLEAVLASTGADRVYLQLDEEQSVDGSCNFYLTRTGGNAAFGVSQSLVVQAREADRVVHVPVASADPIASTFTSVRREGISSSIAIPIHALGKTLGVLYADCVREGPVLTAADLQRVAFIARLLAGALGNRVLVSSLVKATPASDSSLHPALQSSSPSYEEVVERAKLYAPADYTVLIRGETGAGKEVLAHAIHDLSRRKDGPFVPVNCAAIPEQLMESMLFGHEKGAFTGATQSSPGHFDEAHGGTIFLDEVGDMALDLQAKILRVLQDRIVTPVGARKQHRVDVRVLAATHQDLERMVAERRFREDLYYRLRALEVVLPPLRRRTEDILMLCNRFLGEAASELGYDKASPMTTEALDLLHRHPWRGNIRELRHVIQGAALRAAGGPVDVQHLDLASASRPVGGSEGELDDALGGNTWKERLELQEKAALRATLDQAGGNLTRAAELFGVPRTTYREKLVKNGLLGSATKE